VKNCLMDWAELARYGNLVGDCGGLPGEGVLGRVGARRLMVGSREGTRCESPNLTSGESSPSMSLLAEGDLLWCVGARCDAMERGGGFW
jgi:hypothetical protein